MLLAHNPINCSLDYTRGRLSILLTLGPYVRQSLVISDLKVCAFYVPIV
jgi:hypothetical protein